MEGKARGRWLQVEATMGTHLACSPPYGEENDTREEMGWSWAWPNSARLHLFFLFSLFFTVSYFYLLKPKDYEFRIQNCLQIFLLHFILYSKYDLQIFPTIILGFYFSSKDREMYLFIFIIK